MSISIHLNLKIGIIEKIIFERYTVNIPDYTVYFLSNTVSRKTKVFINFVLTERIVTIKFLYDSEKINMDSLNTPEKNKLNEKYATPPNETPTSRRRRRKNKSQATIAALKRREKATATRETAVQSPSITAANPFNTLTTTSSNILTAVVTASSLNATTAEITNRTSTTSSSSSKRRKNFNQSLRRHAIKHNVSTNETSPETFQRIQERYATPPQNHQQSTLNIQTTEEVKIQYATPMDRIETEDEIQRRKNSRSKQKRRSLNPELAREINRRLAMTTTTAQQIRIQDRENRAVAQSNLTQGQIEEIQALDRSSRAEARAILAQQLRISGAAQDADSRLFST